MENEEATIMTGNLDLKDDVVVERSEPKVCNSNLGVFRIELEVVWLLPSLLAISVCYILTDTLSLTGSVLQTTSS